jgi:hypothetical protein
MVSVPPSSPPSSTSPSYYDLTTTTRLPAAEYEALKELRKAVRVEVKRAYAEAAFPLVSKAPDAAGQRHRIALLAWAYVRGIPYRQVEPYRSMQVVAIATGAVIRLLDDGADQPEPTVLPVHTFGRTMQTQGISFYEHHRPDLYALHAFLLQFIPDLAIDRVDLWLHELPSLKGLDLLAKVTRFAERRERQGKPTPVDCVVGDGAAWRLRIPTP